MLLFVLFLINLIPAVWFITLAVYAAVYLLAYRNMDEVFSQAHHLSTTLEKFRAVLVYLEHYTCKPGSHLARLCQPFREADRRPSSYLRRIAGIASAASISANPVVWLLVPGGRRVLRDVIDLVAVILGKRAPEGAEG